MVQVTSGYLWLPHRRNHTIVVFQCFIAKVTWLPRFREKIKNKK